MHDLPEDAERLLASARDAQGEPTFEQRARMRAGIAVALTASAAGAAAVHAKGTSTLLGKLMLGVVGSALVVGAYVARHDVQRVPTAPEAIASNAKRAPSAVVARTPVASAASTEPAPVIEAPAIEAPAEIGVRPVQPSRASRRRAPIPASESHAVVPQETEAAPASSPASLEVEPDATVAKPSLRAELALLARADAALTHGEPELALRVLSEHRQRFPESSLRAEREALTLLVRCERDPRAAADDIRRYLADPNASLRTRLARCGEPR